MADIDKIIAFARSWASENLHEIGYDQDENLIAQSAEQLVEAAEREGITSEDLEEAIGDPEDYVSQAIEENTDNEVDRLAGRDD
jgi:hypothetical protein